MEQLICLDLITDADVMAAAKEANLFLNVHCGRRTSEAVDSQGEGVSGRRTSEANDLKGFGGRRTSEASDQGSSDEESQDIGWQAFLASEEESSLSYLLE